VTDIRRIDHDDIPVARLRDEGQQFFVDQLRFGRDHCKSLAGRHGLEREVPQ